MGPVPAASTPFGDVRRGAVRKTGDRVLVDLGMIDEPGFYEVSLIQGEPPVWLAANTVIDESNVSVLPDEDLVGLITGNGIQMLSVSRHLEEEIKQARVGREIWRILFILALLAFAVQAFLSDRFSNRIMTGGRVIQTGLR